APGTPDGAKKIRRSSACSTGADEVGDGYCPATAARGCGAPREGEPGAALSLAGITPLPIGRRKCESAGIRTNAPTMFQRSMKVSRTPMSAWNLIGDHAQVTTPAARVIPTSATTLPVNATAFP